MGRIAPLILALLLLSAVQPEESRAQQQIPASAEFVASSQGRVYYWVGCSAWTGLKKSNLRFFESREAAEGAGYTPSRSRGCAGPGAGRDVAPEQCVVARIIDGDTFACTSGTRVRLLLIDAPETSQGNLGLRSKLALEELVPEGEAVRLQYDVQRVDRYGRALAHAHTDEGWVNRALVRRGYALVSVYPPNVEGVASLRAAADSARREGIGLWAVNGFRCTPGQHRDGRCR